MTNLLPNGTVENCTSDADCRGVLVCYRSDLPWLASLESAPPNTSFCSCATNNGALGGTDCLDLSESARAELVFAWLGCALSVALAAFALFTVIKDLLERRTLRRARSHNSLMIALVLCTLCGSVASALSFGAIGNALLDPCRVLNRGGYKVACAVHSIYNSGAWVTTVVAMLDGMTCVSAAWRLFLCRVRRSGDPMLAAFGLSAVVLTILWYVLLFQVPDSRGFVLLGFIWGMLVFAQFVRADCEAQQLLVDSLHQVSRISGATQGGPLRVELGRLRIVSVSVFIGFVGTAAGTAIETAYEFGTPPRFQYRDAPGSVNHAVPDYIFLYGTLLTLAGLTHYNAARFCSKRGTSETAATDGTKKNLGGADQLAAAPDGNEPPPADGGGLPHPPSPAAAAAAKVAGVPMAVSPNLFARFVKQISGRRTAATAQQTDLLESGGSLVQVTSKTNEDALLAYDGGWEGAKAYKESKSVQWVRNEGV